MEVISATTAIGDSVVNPEGDNLGKIEEVMLEVDTGKVAYAVLSFGGILGMGDKLFAVPWSTLHLDTANHRFVMGVDRQVLENAPGFDKDNWRNMADPTWAKSVSAHYA